MACWPFLDPVRASPALSALLATDIAEVMPSTTHSRPPPSDLAAISEGHQMQAWTILNVVSDLSGMIDSLRLEAKLAGNARRRYMPAFHATA
jgi:hypothetical protein